MLDHSQLRVIVKDRSVISTKNFHNVKRSLWTSSVLPEFRGSDDTCVQVCVHACVSSWVGACACHYDGACNSM